MAGLNGSVAMMVKMPVGVAPFAADVGDGKARLGSDMPEWARGDRHGVSFFWHPSRSHNKYMLWRSDA